MKIVNVPTVDGDEIERELGIRIYDCEFAQMAENGGYVILDLTTEHIEDLREELEWNKDKCCDSYVERIANELKVIDYFRGIGYDIEILVFIAW